MIRRILVPLDLSPYSQQATERACAIARAHRAQVTGMTVLDTPEIAGVDVPIHAALVPEMLKRQAERTKDAKARIADALKRFAETCEEQGVAYLESESQGVPADCIVQAAVYYDLLVMGLRTHFHFETQEGPGRSLEQVLNHSITPVLAVPKHGDEPFKKVLVAFDGSLNAARGLRALAAFEPVYDLHVTLLMSDEEPERAEFYLDQAASFLRAHRFEKVETVTTDREIGDVIDGDYIDEVDLVVAGIHSRRRIKDFFLGSLTTRLIDYGHTALLLGQ